MTYNHPLIKIEVHEETVDVWTLEELNLGGAGYKKTEIKIPKIDRSPRVEK